MSWVKLDDLYDDNRKVKRAYRREPVAVAIHAMAITYCARHDTDGLVDLDWLEERMPDDEQRARVLAVLADAGLLEALPAGETLIVHVEDRTKLVGAHDVTLGPLAEDAYVVHDFLDYNQSSIEADSKRAAEAARKREARVRAASARTRDGLRAESAPRARPRSGVPTRPDPTDELPLSPSTEARDAGEGKMA